MKLQNLRKKHPNFIYEKYSYEISGNNLEIFFDFKIPPDIEFKPKVIIENLPKKLLRLNLDNLIFHLGLMEIPSYWKTTCSPKIIIKAGSLNKEQINWWKDLIINGMGQFFYENKIDFRKPNFLIIKIINGKLIDLRSQSIDSTNKKKGDGVLVPVGGGKDSAVTLELLKKAEENIRCFSLNPTDAALKIMKVGDCKNPIIVRRKIDEKLLELNRKGFLNGHTPFSAYLAFLNVLIAIIFDIKYIALSNERSSNEGNVKYLGKIINHQWSKSFEFEKKFRKYSKKYLSKGVEYFSFLRPLYEIQIAKLFSKFPKYFDTFLSCNEAYKTASGTKNPEKSWCKNCSKCLFAFMILYPFISEKKLFKIFGENLFENKSLLLIVQELIGERAFKPFECVGTEKEGLIALYLSWRKFKKQTHGKLPFLLNYFEEKILPKYPNLEKESKKLITSWDKENNLLEKFEKILKKVAS